MQDWKMEEKNWGKATRWKMQDRKMEEQIWGKVRRWKMQDRKMEEQILVKPEGGKCGTGKCRTTKLSDSRPTLKL